MPYYNVPLVNLNLEQISLPSMGFEPTCAFAHWILSLTP